MGIFGILSDLDDKNWSDSATSPPDDKRKDKEWLKTYGVYGITRCTEEGDHMRLGLSHDNGTQRKGLLYHAKDDPFKEVGHAWFAFDDRDVIIGMAIEQDWVVMGTKEKPQAEVLKGIKPPVEKVKEIKRAETVDLGVYGDLDHSKWQKHRDGAPHMGRAGKGYHMYNINGPKGDLKDGSIRLAIELETAEGADNHIACPAMHNVRVNPFRSMTRAFLKIENDEIVGVMTESDEWVDRK